MRALVLGGTRFIGRRVVEELLEAGHRVTLYTRGRVRDAFEGRVERLIGERRSAADLTDRLSGRDFDAAYDFLSYEASDARLAIETLAGRVGHFIHISTCSVYWCTGDFPCPVAEGDFDRLSDFAERPGSIEYEYGYNKRKAEEALFAAHQERAFPVTTIRMPIIGGEDDPSLRYLSYVLRLSDGGPVALPDGGYAPFRHVYVADAARALAALAGRTHSIGQAYNLAGADILSVRGVVAAMADLLGRRAETVDIPTPILRAMGLGTSFSPFSQQAAQVPAIFKARRDLGWETTPHRVWLERTVEWSLRVAGSLPEPPPPVAHRSREIEVIEAYRRAVVRFDGAAGSSGEPRG
ncbi:MAG TPA: NAD-dependent epimerase/dehydratase family protein [Candidatus Polarisedimenticolia bacterium]|jgi:nucleoside-diphosphate-sugar epimerase